MIIGIDDISTFKVFFDVIYEDTDVVELQCNSTGMKCSILDKSHTCFYEVFYENSFFDLFDVDGSEIILLSIDDLVKILKNSHKDDYLTINADGERVLCKFEHDGNRRVFELTQLADFGESPAPPKLDTTCKATIFLDDLDQSLKDFSTFKTGQCMLTCNESGFIIASKVDASLQYKQELDVEVTGSGDASYTVDYLKKVTKFKKINNEVTLEFGDTLPLLWSIKNNWVSVKGLIAPRIDMEE